MEEDCYGKFDPYNQEDMKCWHCWQAHDDPDHNIIGCIDTYSRVEVARHKAEWDAKTPEQQAEHTAFLKELRKLY